MYHWTDQKIRIHAFYCMLGVSLLQQVRCQAEAAWPGLSTEELLERHCAKCRSLLCCTRRKVKRDPIEWRLFSPNKHSPSSDWHRFWALRSLVVPTGGNTVAAE